MQKTESNVAFIPFPKGQGVFPRRFDKEREGTNMEISYKAICP